MNIQEFVSRQLDVRILTLFTIVLVSAGCISGSDLPHQEKTTASILPVISNKDITPVTGPPYVYITYPAFDGGVESGDVNMTVLVENFTISTPETRYNVPGEGHLIYYIDVIPPVSPGYPAVTGVETSQVTNETHAIWHGVQQNTHTFSVQLVNNDNTPLMPPVIDAVDVTVYNPLP